MTREEQLNKVEKSYHDMLRFIDEGEYEYAEIAVRTITEIIVISYSEYYTPNIVNKDDPKKEPTIDQRIKELKDNPLFPNGQISNLHTMRQVGNMGAHQGRNTPIPGQEVQVRSSVSIVEKEIENWKTFISEGHESLAEIHRANYERLLHGDPKDNKQKMIVALIVSILGIAAIVFFTKEQTMQWFINGTHFETIRLWTWYVSYFIFLVLAGYSRPHGTANKLVCDLGMLYFLVPRGYLVYLCLKGQGGFFTLIGNMFLCAAIFGIYVVLSIVVAEQHEGYTIRGYKL